MYLCDPEDPRRFAVCHQNGYQVGSGGCPFGEVFKVKAEPDKVRNCTLPPQDPPCINPFTATTTPTTTTTATTTATTTTTTTNQGRYLIIQTSFNALEPQTNFRLTLTPTNQ